MNKPQVTLIHHTARRGHRHPPNSIAGVEFCLAAGARIIEVDISPLADGEFALLHGPRLESGTTGSGLISEHTAGEVSQLNRTWQGSTTDEPVGLLGQALDLLQAHAGPVELQLDLKPYVRLTAEVLRRLVRALHPVRDRVRVTTPADWLLRRLHALDGELSLGFDPLLYLEEGGAGLGDRAEPPFRVGTCGYWDDHPLASIEWDRPADYLAARAEALWTQAPVGAVWYIAASLLDRTLDDGFDWIDALHAHGAEVDAWTLDPDRPEQVALARRLIAAGVDRITTNDAPALAAVLGDTVTY